MLLNRVGCLGSMCNRALHSQISGNGLPGFETRHALKASGADSPQDEMLPNTKETC